MNQEPDKPLIVVVEDDYVVLKAMVLLLETYGYEVKGCDNVEDLLARVKGDSPALILADYRLRDGHNGIEAIDALRQYCHRQVPALLITGDTSDSWEDEALRHDLPVLRKPVNPPSLSAAIHRALVAA